MDFANKNSNPYRKKYDKTRYGAIVAQKPILDKSKMYGYTPMSQNVPTQNKPSTYTPQANVNYTPVPNKSSYTPSYNTPQQESKDGTQMYLDYLRSAQEKNQQMQGARIPQIQQATDRQLSGVNEAYDISKQNMDRQVQGLEKSSESYRDKVLQDIDLSREGTASEKAGVEEQYGQSEQSLIKAKQAQDIKRRNLFASLGTLESGGNMGFGGRQGEADNQFMMDLQDFKEGKISDLGDIDRRQKEFENNALYTLETEVSKINTQIEQINNDARLNDVQRKTAVEKILSDAETTIYQIGQDASDKMSKYEKMRFEVGSKLGDATSSKYQKLETDIAKSVTDLLNRDLGGITGLMKFGWVPGSPAAYTQTVADNLKSQLQLRYAELLKGAGAVSDAERRILENASSRLNQNINEQDFRAVLEELANLYGGQASNVNNDAVSALKSSGFTDEEISEYLGGQ